MEPVVFGSGDDVGAVVGTGTNEDDPREPALLVYMVAWATCQEVVQRVAKGGWPRRVRNIKVWILFQEVTTYPNLAIYQRQYVIAILETPEH